MKVFRRSAPDAAVIAAARAAEIEAKVAESRAMAELDRERQRVVDRDERKRRKVAAKLRARRRARRRELLGVARTVAPLLLVNGAAIGGQAAYAFTRTSTGWPPAARLIVAAVYAATVESISLYVNWHAHDALMSGATGTAAEMRRRSYLIAAVVGALNYSHFDGENWSPTPFAVGGGMASLLSPWLWGLHTRRAQHVQLLRKDLVDETGAVFDRKRRRAFPFRTWAAERWSIEHNVRDPKVAWDRYNAERRHRLAHRPAGRVRAAVTVLRGKPVPGTPAAVAAVPIEPDVRELLAEVRGQARDARQTTTVRAYQMYRHPERPSDGQIGGNSDRQNGRTSDRQNGRQNVVSDDDLEAFVRLVSEPPTSTDTPDSGRQNPAGRPVKKATSEQANGPGRPPKQVAKAARVAAKMPGAPTAVIARKAGVSEATARRATKPPKEK